MTVAMTTMLFLMMMMIVNVDDGDGDYDNHYLDGDDECFVLDGILNLFKSTSPFNKWVFKNLIKHRQETIFEMNKIMQNKI